MVKILQKNGGNGNETEKFVSKLKNEYKIINTTTSNDCSGIFVVMARNSHKVRIEPIISKGRKNMTNDLVIVERVPTLEEYTKICTAVGWGSVMNFGVAHEALNNSLYCVVAIVSDEVVGMGRVVGDGRIYFYIQDVAVMPEYQNNGIGKEILNSIINYLITNAPAKAFVGLFAANGTEKFYESFKLRRHNDLTGLFRVI